jgi:hypothetical protein
VAAAEDEPQYGVNVRAKRREGFARAVHKRLDCPIAPAQRAQFFDYALASASASMLPPYARRSKSLPFRHQDSAIAYRVRHHTGRFTHTIHSFPACAKSEPLPDTTRTEGNGMAIRTPREGAARFRQNAADCEEASKQMRPEERARLLEAAAHYRMLAEKIEPSWTAL